MTAFDKMVYLCWEIKIPIKNGRKKKKAMDKFQKKCCIFLLFYAMFCAVISFLFHTVWMLNYIPSESMENTLREGDFVIASRLETGEEDIKRYDILIFVPPDNPEEIYIKRVIGLPGETIEVFDGEVYADDVKLDSSFIKEPQDGDGDGSFIVPSGHYFFLGDNRNHSYDSRYWMEEYVPLDNIVAKATHIIFPFQHRRKI